MLQEEGRGTRLGLGSEAPAERVGCRHLHRQRHLHASEIRGDGVGHRTIGWRVVIRRPDSDTQLAAALRGIFESARLLDVLG